MSGLNRPTLRIDQPRDPVGGASVLATGGQLASPAIPLPAAPSSLTVINTALARSAVTPTAIVNLRWLPPQGIPVGGYVLQWATDAGFTTPTRLDYASDKVDGAVPNLPCGVIVFFRIATIAPTGLVGPFGAPISQATPSDTTPPAAPTSPAAAFLNDGSLRVTWAKPSSANFRAVELRIYNSASKTVEYEVVAEADGTLYVWPASRNRQQSVGSPDGSPDPSVYVELRSLSWGGVYSSAVSATATKARPANISGLSVDFSGRDAVFTCAAIADAVAYLWTIDGQLYETTYPTFTYRLEENILRHSGTPVASLPYSIRARDALDQTSLTAATGTAVNTAPAAPSAVSLLPFPNQLAIGVTATKPTDFLAFRYRVVQTAPAASDVTFESTGGDLFYGITTKATYRIGVRVVDVFGQASSETLSAAIAADALTTEELRAEAIYSNSLGTSGATLKAALGDDDAGTTFTYADSGSVYNWTQVERPLLDRYRVISYDAATTLNLFIATSADGATWRWFAGPLVDGYLAVEVASEAAAGASPINTGATPLADTRIELPTTVEARFVRLYHRKVGSSYTLRTYYPNTEVTADMIRAGAIRTINLAAGVVTAAKISVAQLSAIAADMGNLTAGTITGGTIRSAASGARWEGNSTRLFGTDGTNTQWEVLNTNGKFTAGAGNITVGRDGIVINTPVGGALAASNEIRFTFDGVEIGKLASGGSIFGAGTGIVASGAATAFLQAANGGDQTILSVAAAGVSISGSYGLNIGDASGAAAGTARIKQRDAGTTDVVSTLILQRASSGAAANGFGTAVTFQLEAAAGEDRNMAQIRASVADAANNRGRLSLFAGDNTTLREGLRVESNGSAPLLGFLGAAGIARQTVAAAATDLASVITLANDTRAKLILFGLFQ